MPSVSPAPRSHPRRPAGKYPAGATAAAKVKLDRTAIVADPHPLWLDAIVGLVERLGLVVVGSTTSSAEAIALVGEERPDILITDAFIEGDRGNALSFVQRACKAVPGMRTIVVSSCEDVQLIDGTLESGAFAYIVKTAEADDISSTIRQSFEASVYLGRQASVASAVPIVADESLLVLTKREREILAHVAEGYSNAQLARMLWVTEQTVKFHLSNIYRKLHVSNRTAASRWAQANGVVANAGASAQLAEVESFATAPTGLSTSVGT
jgi:two-component system, NarL family, response regulator LiaR